MGLFRLLRERRSIFSQWEKAWILTLPGVQVSGEAIQREMILKGDFPTSAHHGEKVPFFFYIVQYMFQHCALVILGASQVA